MASREKRPLAPSSKSKQKANNDPTLPASSSKTKKAKLSPYILEATGSKLSPKLEASLPRKKVLTSLKCKKKLRAVKSNLIKGKGSKNAPVKNLKRIPVQTANKTTKPSLTRIKARPSLKPFEEEIYSSDKSEFSPSRGSPKTNRKLKLSSLSDSQKSAKLTRRTLHIKEEIDTDLKNRKSSPPNDQKTPRARLDSPLPKSSVDSTIDDVLAMVSDSELDYSALPSEGKVTRSRRMIDDKSVLLEHEIKKEIIEEDFDEDELTSNDDLQTAIDIKESKRKFSQRSLRNGKLRQLDSSQSDDLRKARRPNVDETMTSEYMENATVDETVESTPSEITIGDTSLSLSSDSRLGDVELSISNEHENNNNSGISGADGGPTLRSKTKAKTTDPQITPEDEEFYIIEPLDDSKKPQTLGKLTSLDKIPAKRRSSLNIDVKKTIGSLYGNEKADGTAPKSQIDQMIENIKLTIAKSIESKIFGPEKALGLTKSFEPPNSARIEEIIIPVSTETRKLNLDPPEIIIDDDQPNGSNGTNEMSLQNTSNNINHSCNSSTSNNTDNSDDTMPKVADTAKEIEKLVMGGESEEIKLINDSIESPSSRTDDIETHDEIEHDSRDSNERAKTNDIEKSERMMVERDREDVCMIEQETLDELEKSLQTSESLENPIQPETIESISRELESLISASPSLEASANETKHEDTVGINFNNDMYAGSEYTDEPSQLILSSPNPNHAEKLIPERSDSPQNSPEAILTSSEDCDSVSLRLEASRSIDDIEQCPEKPLQSPEIPPESKQEDGKRVLRTRDKQRKFDKSKTSEILDSSDVKVKTEPDNLSVDSNELSEAERRDSPQIIEPSDSIKVEEGYQGRTRRSRDIKRRREDVFLMQNTCQKSKRNRREPKKTEQNKEETLLDNEVAKINENNGEYSAEKFNKRLEGTKSLRIFSEHDRIDSTEENDRSKSENDIESIKEKSECVERLHGDQCDSNGLKNIRSGEMESKSGMAQTVQKDCDEASTSGESIPKILETPEETAMKEKILLMLGLESAEKAAERKKAKVEQCAGGLKTVIRVPKDSSKEKKRSRSPLKMVLKQGRLDGGGDSPEFYTIQKELGTSGLGDSSSDEDPEETAAKDRQSLIIPEKSSSFSIHPGRLCADVCCYCFGKFGSLDTPMHLAQMKSDDRRRKILSVERHLTKDSCLCDACYRHVDRKANTSPTNVSKPQRQHRQLMVSKCSARDCRDSARHLVKRRWLLKIKSCLQNQVDIDWETSQHTSMSFCPGHYATIERFLTCALCKRRLVRNHTHLLPATEADELNRLLPQQGIPVLLVSGTFVCKLCRYYTQLQLKYKDVENMNVSHRSFAKSYRKRILYNNNLDIEDDEDEPAQNYQSKDSKDKDKDKDKEKDREKEKDKDKDKDKDRKSAKKSAKYHNPLPKSHISKSPDCNSSEKSTPEPPKPDSLGEPKLRESDPRIDETSSITEQMLDLESAVEKLKKRKALDQHLYSTDSPIFSDDNTVNVVEILAMDKEEVTLTRLPKKSKLAHNQNQNSNDITPVVQRLGANPSISVRTLFPGEEEMGLHANIEFSNIREITPQGWEKCATIIQYDRDTKLLWQELQRPYGNQSSFLRHLILLEKYYRSGDLVLAPNASRNAINYSTSVQNRLISYEGPEKMDEPITEPIPTEFHHSKRLSGGYLMDRERTSLPGNSGVVTPITTVGISVTSNPSTPSKILPSNTPSKCSSSRILKINPGVSIIKKPPPNLQRLSLSSSSGNSTSSSCTPANGSTKRKDIFPNKITGGGTSGGKVFQLSEPDFKRLQSLKKQKMMNQKSNTSNHTKLSNLQYQKAQIAAQTQFQKHLRMQQEMLNRQSRGDFEPLICDVRSLANENTPAQNLLNNLNLPKSIQVTTKPANSPIPILPKIPKSLTVIPQTVPRNLDK
ncbi:uncharacterized protein [Fopius arisanus]|uniref:Uncharacterized protein isoform X2 n=1 Tax=Fopius arisanus TaxID=64838 RepID=A0A9R1U8L1_9HYME|nr:PREDICTED: uncharacterized protein LOC105272495 isoform X2 [Fopius arisanus]